MKIIAFRMNILYFCGKQSVFLSIEPNQIQPNMKPEFKIKMISMLIVLILSFSCSNAPKMESETKSETPMPESESYDEMVLEEAPMETSEYSKSSASAQQTGQAGEKYSEQIISSSAATNLNIEPGKKIIRTADLKFKVADVIHSTYEIENIVKRTGGYIAYTSLESVVQTKNNHPISKDSTLVNMSYIVTNTITIRTPWEKMDTTLQLIAPLVEYLDYRVVKTEDVTLKLFGNKLKEMRLARYQARMKQLTAGGSGSLDAKIYAEQQILNQQEEADNNLLEELATEDKVKYATIILTIYENEKFEQWLIPNPDEARKFEPNFFEKLWNALSTGWEVLEAIILFIFQLWGVLILFLGVYFLTKFIVKKLKKT